MVTIATISDCHGQWARGDYPLADVLVFAGDILKNYSYHRDDDAFEQLAELVLLRKHLDSLLDSKRYKQILLCAGNHDFVFQHRHREALATLGVSGCGSPNADSRIHYLQDTEVQLEIDGAQWRFYGAPHQPFFGNWAFNFPDHEAYPTKAAMVAKSVWKKIPPGIDVLITHGPPFGVLDECISGERVGCKHLLQRIENLGSEAPKLHLFGHIHHSFGQLAPNDIRPARNAVPWYTHFVNTAILGEDYRTIRSMPVIELAKQENKNI